MLTGWSIPTLMGERDNPLKLSLCKLTILKKEDEALDEKRLVAVWRTRTLGNRRVLQPAKCLIGLGILRIGSKKWPLPGSGCRRCHTPSTEKKDQWTNLLPAWKTTSQQGNHTSLPA